MNYLSVDAGPFIGLFYEKDTYHQQCVHGFTQLAKNKTILITPIPTAQRYILLIALM